jgi:hypothetical protein
MLWKNVSHKECSPLCFDQVIEQYRYSKHHTERYGQKYRTNKAISLSDVADIDRAVEHFATDLQLTKQAIESAIRIKAEAFLDQLACATRCSVQPFVKAAFKAGALPALAEKLTTLKDEPEFYTLLMRTLFVAGAITKLPPQHQENLAKWLGKQLLHMPRLFLLPHYEHSTTVNIPMFLLVMETALPVIKIILAHYPAWIGRMFARRDICNDEFSIAFFTLLTKYPALNTHLRDKDRQKQLAQPYLTKWLAQHSWTETFTPDVRKAISLLCRPAWLATPFQTFRTMRRKLPVGSCSALIRLGGERWEHSVLAQAMMNHHFSSYLLEFGIDEEVADRLLQHRSLRKLVQELHGTAHEEEVRHISLSWQPSSHGMEGFYFHGMAGFYSLSCLQVLYTNTVKNKLDRHAYLEFLKRHNDAMESTNPVRRAFFMLNPQVFQAVSHVLPHTLFTSWIEQNNIQHHATDMLDNYTCLHDVLFANQDPVLIERQTDLVKRWLAKNTSDNPVKLHQYLISKTQRDRAPQGKWCVELTPLHGAAHLTQWLGDQSFNVEGRAYRFFVPRDGNDLGAIGKAQKHCIGATNYRRLGISGRSLFFVIMPLRSFLNKEGNPRSPTPKEFWRQVGDGYAVQMDADFKVTQAKGRMNATCPKKILDSAMQLLLSCAKDIRAA